MADLALLLLTLTWGTTFWFVHGALEGTSPAVFLCLRFGVATVAVGAVVLARRDWRRTNRDTLKHGVLLGLTMLGGFALQTEGLRLTTPSRSGFLTGLAVLVVPFLTLFMFRHKIRFFSWLGVLCAVAGLTLLTRPFGDDVPAKVRLGDLLTAGCAVSYGFQIVLTGEWSARHPLSVLTFLQITVTFVGALLLLPLEPFHLENAPPLWGTVAFTGLAMTAVAFFIQNWGQRHTTAVRAAIIYSLEPVAAALFAHFYGGEPLAPADWAGGGLIALGVVVAEVGGAILARRAADAV